MRLAIRLVALGVLVCLSACTHSMTIVNRRQYEGLPSISAQKSLRFSVETDVTAEDTRDLVEAVKEALAASSSVERVAFAIDAPSDFKPDYIVRIRPVAEYEGSGWNYAIAFPGFLLFTHAWNGFVYGADVDTDIEIRKPDVDRAFASQTVQTHWNLRHCDFERGAWTSSGWYTPFYGGINLIIGFFMIPYDEDATPEFVTEVHKPYGRYVAAKVLELTAKIPAVSSPPPSVSVAPTPSVAP